MTTREWVLLKQEQVPGYTQSDYACERIMAPAADGASIPISLVYAKAPSHLPTPARRRHILPATPGQPHKMGPTFSVWTAP